MTKSVLEYEYYFTDKLIDFYVQKRKQGFGCEVATVKAFHKVYEVAFTSFSRMDESTREDTELIFETVNISRAMLNIKKDKSITQRMEDTFAFSKIKTVKPEHLKLLM
jgi:uncharacterized protein YwqG